MSEANGATATAERPQAEANGANAEGANGDNAAKGTPASNASVHPDENAAANAATTGEDNGAPADGGDNAPDGDGAGTPDDLTVSEKTAGLRETVAEERGYEKARTEFSQGWETRRAELIRLAQSDEANTTPQILRAQEAALRALADPEAPLTAAEIDSVLKPGREAMGRLAEIALAMADDDYRRHIDRIIPDEAERKAYWEKAGGMPVHRAIDHLIEVRAKDSTWLRNADPEEVIAKSTKLAAHISALEDAAKKAGRFIRENVDRSGDRSAGAGAGAATPRYSSLAEARALHASGDITNAQMNEAKARFGNG